MMQTTIPPKVRLFDKTGLAVDGNTQPEVGRTHPDYSLPVVLAKGVDIVQTYASIPEINKTSSDSFHNTLIKILDYNENRRFLKIVNNGPSDVELWSGFAPSPNVVGMPLPQGEVLYAQGYGIFETDTCRQSVIYASCSSGASGLLVMEG